MWGGRFSGEPPGVASAVETIGVAHAPGIQLLTPSSIDSETGDIFDP